VPIVEHSAVVGVAIDDAFDLSQSYGLRLEWDPFVKSQRLLNDATVAGKGVRTLTLSRHGLRMISEYLSFRRPDSVAMKMVEGPILFRLFSGTWQFKKIDDATTSVLFKYHFDCRPSWLHWLMHPVGRWFLGREIRRRLLAFQRAAETPGMIERLRAEIANRRAS
jgi:ribosome-associated toxin RatA of RatAB toxin-antitoxin module